MLRVFAPNTDAVDFWTKLGFQPRLIQFTALIDRLERETLRADPTGARKGEFTHQTVKSESPFGWSVAHRAPAGRRRMLLP